MATLLIQSIKPYFTKLRHPHFLGVHRNGVTHFGRY